MKHVWQMTINLSVLVILSNFTLMAQGEPIVLDNPSFEDMPRHSKEPRFWTNCGNPGESPPDVQPDYTFQVSKSAFDGNTYLGMVVRDNDTWEEVGQMLSSPMRQGTCYKFSIKLARSLTYYSVSREKNTPANYIEPVKLRIWGGFGKCDKRELLDESPLISNVDWQEFKFKFEPQADYTHFVLEAFYKTPSLFPYNGNLLLDDASAIEPIPCDTNIPAVAQAPSVLPPLVNNGTKEEPISPVIARRSPPDTTNRAGSKGPKTMFGVSKEDLVAGLTVPIEDVEFEANSAALLASTTQYLDELEAFLRENPNVIVEIGGHTNGLADKAYADELSAQRARAVVDYLKANSVSPIQLRYRGYGKRYPVASDSTPQGRKKNQRVEVKIVAIIKQ